MGRISNSTNIAKASWSVLKSEKELVVLPILGFFSTVLVMGVFGGLAFITIGQTTTAGTTEYDATPLTYAIGVLAYFAATTTGMFFLAALVSGAHQRLTGGEATLGSSLGGAARRFPQIVAWSALVATVGLVLQAIEDRAGFLGVIVANLVGMAWQIVTWLAVPVIEVEGTGPISSLKSAAGLFKKTWGENLIAQVGFGLLGFLAALPGVIIGIGLIAIGEPATFVAGSAILVIWIAAVAVIMSALNGIFRTALYLYASTGEVPAAFPTETIENAFRHKGKGISGALGR
jgi:hypothetical protein